MNMKNFHR